MWLSCRDTVREESHSRSDAIRAGSEILLSLDLFPYRDMLSYAHIVIAQNGKPCALNGKHSIEPLNLCHHPADMGIAAVFRTRFEDVITSPGISPFQDLDRDAAHSPLIHL